MATASRDHVTQHGAQDLAAAPREPRDQSRVTVLWTSSDVRCVIARYDETRYQLRLLRDLGTVKTELFEDCAEALAVSRDWRLQVRGIDPPDTAGSGR